MGAAGRHAASATKTFQKRACCREEKASSAQSQSRERWEAECCPAADVRPLASALHCCRRKRFPKDEDGSDPQDHRASLSSHPRLAWARWHAGFQSPLSLWHSPHLRCSGSHGCNGRYGRTGSESIDPESNQPSNPKLLWIWRNARRRGWSHPWSLAEPAGTDGNDATGMS